MRVFTQIIKDNMNVYGHDIPMLAENLSLSMDELQGVLQESLCPGPEFIDQLTDIYHLDKEEEAELRKAWRKARIEFANKLNKVERQLNATTALRSMPVGDDTPVASRILYVLAASQYYHNALVSIEMAPEIVQELVQMRNIIVYNYGSDDFKKIESRLMDDDVWTKITETVSKVYSYS